MSLGDEMMAKRVQALERRAAAAEAKLEMVQDELRGRRQQINELTSAAREAFSAEPDLSVSKFAQDLRARVIESAVKRGVVVQMTPPEPEPPAAPEVH